MPITKELENIRKFESVGFTHAQAEILAETLEQSHADGQQSLKDAIHKEIGDLRKDITNEIVNLEFRIKASHADLLMKIFAIVAGCTSIAVAVSKLL